MGMGPGMGQGAGAFPNPAQQFGGMGGMGGMGMQQQQVQQAQGGMPNGNWNAFGAGVGAGPAQQQQRPQAQQSTSGFGGQPAASAPQNVDDLMNQAMAGVSNMSLQQRIGNAPSGGGMSMQAMQFNGMR